MNKNILVVGAGISGLGAVKLSKHLNYNVRVTSRDIVRDVNKKVLRDLSVEFEEGQHSLSNLDWANLIIKSPGVPQNITLLKQARLMGISIISEIEFAYQNTNAIIIAITGTNGKTTTAQLLHFILKRAGLNVALAGNIGVSFSESVLQNNIDYYVLEVSSFQLEDIVDFRPNISIVLNIQKDHLNRYDNNFQDYIKTKMKIQVNQTNQDSFIYFHKDKQINNKLKNVKAQKYPFGDSDIGDSYQYGGWHKHNTITINTLKNKFTMTIHNLALQGTHNFYNSMAASIAASSIGIKKEIIKNSLSNFKGVEHRLEFVAKISGTKFINDSKATNCNAVYYALDTISSPIVWICGGVDKGNDYSILTDLVQDKVKAIIVLGSNTNKIENNFKKHVDKMVFSMDMQQAVNKAFSISDVGDTILLSPACASFDLFKDYQDRGRSFKNCVLSI